MTLTKTRFSHVLVLAVLADNRKRAGRVSVFYKTKILRAFSSALIVELSVFREEFVNTFIFLCFEKYFIKATEDVFT